MHVVEFIGKLPKLLNLIVSDNHLLLCCSCTHATSLRYAAQRAAQRSEPGALIISHGGTPHASAICSAPIHAGGGPIRCDTAPLYSISRIAALSRLGYQSPD